MIQGTFGRPAPAFAKPKTDPAAEHIKRVLSRTPAPVPHVVGVTASEVNDWLADLPPFGDAE